MSFNLENRLILRSSPGTLSRIASFKLALFCWQQHLKNYPSSSLFVEIKTTIRVSDIIRVSLPKSTTELINRHIELLKWKLYSWSTYHLWNVFGKLRHDQDYNTIFNCLDCVVLKPSGSTICFKSTAKNLMANNRLSVMEKYSIACTYCFIEYIEYLWPLIPDHCRPSTLPMNYSTNVNRNVFGGYLPFKLEFLSTANASTLENNFHTNTVNRDIFGVYLPAKLEYLNGANASIPKNILMSIIYVEDETSLDMVIFLLSNLDTTRQTELIMKFSIKLLKILALHDEEPSVRTLQFWYHVKDYITDDQFCDLIEFLCRVAFSIFKNCGIYVDVLLDEIWSSASNHQRTRVVDYFSRFPSPIFEPLYHKTIDKINYCGNVEFFLNILDCLSYENRKTFWCNHWDEFIDFASVSGLNSMMSLCLKDEDEIAKFTQNCIANYSKLERTWKRFVLTGKYQELTEYLTFFYMNGKSAQEILQKILNSLLEDDLYVKMMITSSVRRRRNHVRSHACRFNLYSDQCVQFNKLIDNGFPFKDSAQQFKKDFILYYVGLRKDNLSSSFMLEEIRDMADAFFSEDRRCLIEMKMKIYELCRSMALIKLETELHIRKRMIDEWRDFFMWCGFKKVFALKVESDVCDTYQIVCSGKVKKIKESKMYRRIKVFKNFFSNMKNIF